MWMLRPASATTVPEMNRIESPGRNGKTTSPVSAKITSEQERVEPVTVLRGSERDRLVERQQRIEERREHGGIIATKAPAEAARLSIVVLPFTNLSNDPAQDYFADGVTENLTTELSRLHNSFVIARNTAFTFKGKNLDAKAIGKELGVRYVLEGSVQRDANRVRVNAQLIDAEIRRASLGRPLRGRRGGPVQAPGRSGRAPRPHASGRAGERRSPA